METKSICGRCWKACVARRKSDQPSLCCIAVWCGVAWRVEACKDEGMRGAGFAEAWGIACGAFGPEGPSHFSLLGPKKSNPKKWPGELVGCAGYEPGRLRFGLMVCGPSLCGAAIPRASVHGAEELLALRRLRACTITLCCDRSRAQLTQRGYTATRRGIRCLPKG
jgi:hypothetical protein